MGFDIMSLQKGRGPVQARSKAGEGRAVLKYIDVDDLVPSEDNFYSMSDIDELAALIELSGGVKQPALVSPLGGGKYKVIAGHRRRLASLQLVKQGKEQYRKMPCMVDTDEREQLTALDRARAMKRSPSIDEVKCLREELRTPEPLKAERYEPEPAEDGPKYGPGVYVREEPNKSQIVPPPSPPPEPPAVENAGEVVDSPPPAPEKEMLSAKQAAYILEDLQMFCEEMLGLESERTEMWAERADALTVAIDALRR